MRVVVRNQDTNGKRAEDVEEQDTPEDTLHGLGDVLTRILGFTGSDSNHFDTTVREGSVDKSREPTQETTFSTACNVLVHGTRSLPVVETKSAFVRSTAQIDDESKDQETNNGNDLDTGKDKLGFTIDRYCEDIQTEDENNDDRYPCRDVNIRSTRPEANDGGGSRNFSAEGDCGRVPIVPADSKTQSVIAISRAILWNSTRKR